MYTRLVVKYPCTLKQLIGGDWQARSMGSDAGTVEVIASTREDALAQLSKEIRYRLEWCPCSGVADEFVELEVTDKPDSWPRGRF